MPVRIDASEFLADMQRLKSDIHAELKAAFEQAAQETVEVMREHGYTDRTGTLSRSMYGRSDTRGMFDLRAELGATAPHALYVDKPTKKHKIYPRGSYRGSEGEYAERGTASGKRGAQRDRVWFRAGQQWLRWFENGKPVFRKWVNHPGTKGAFFSEAAAKNVWRFAELSQIAVDRAVSRHD